jgi:hypothetical protein
MTIGHGVGERGSNASVYLPLLAFSEKIKI